MKKLWYLVMAFGLVACQAEKVDVDGGTAGEGEKQYLSVNILSSNVGSRAAEDGDYQANGGDYVDGTGNENEVKTIRFFFFDDSDNAVDVHHETNNYVDVQNPSGGGNDHSESVEKILNAVVVIDSKAGDKTPSKVIAVLNPTDAMKNYQSITKLNEAVYNHNLSLTDNKFVMSNSISSDGSTPANKIEAVSVEGHLYPTESAAKENPVTIYVERVLAKVEVTVGLTAATGEGVTSGIYETGETVGNEKVYVQFLGWNTTTTTDKSYLMKNIDLGWQDNDLFGASEPWNWAKIRSFWAINPSGDNAPGYVYGPFQAPSSGTADNVAQALGFGTSNNYTYIQENAAEANTTSPNCNKTKTPSQVILAAKLVKKDGTAFTIAEFAGRKYGSLSDAKTALADLANVYVKKSGTTSTTEYEKISSDDLDFITAWEESAGESDKNMNNKPTIRYVVYVVLKSGKYSESKYYYWDGTYLNDNSTKNMVAFDSETAVNTKLKEIGSVKVWNDGYTYYYFDIRHLYNPDLSNKEDPDYAAKLEAAQNHPGYYGVVRNHLYRCSVKTLSGLGTPVYDPDEIIIPEIPEDDDVVIAAEIKILSWRIVDHGYDLAW